MPTWLRCEDEHGNQFDLSPDSHLVTAELVKVLDKYPPNTGLTAVARADKPRADKAAKPQASAGKSAAGSNTGRDVGQPEKE